jgi:nucleoid-associated protein YgaU
MEAITRRLGAMENALSTVSAAQEATGGRLTATLEDLNRISVRLSGLTAAPSPSAEEAAVPAGPVGEAMFLYHEPRKGETLWSIAKRYYGKGGFYPVLLEHNPGLGIYFDPDYGGIRVLKDRQRAKEVFAAVMSSRGNSTLFRYRVVEGDTWEQVSRRLFGHASKATELATLNPSIGLVAGERVFVPLP